MGREARSGGVDIGEGDDDVDEMEAGRGHGGAHRG